jgi:hypothetical protein
MRPRYPVSQPATRCAFCSISAPNPCSPSSAMPLVWSSTPAASASRPPASRPRQCGARRCSSRLASTRLCEPGRQHHIVPGLVVKGETVPACRHALQLRHVAVGEWVIHGRSRRRGKQLAHGVAGASRHVEQRSGKIGHWQVLVGVCSRCKYGQVAKFQIYRMFDSSSSAPAQNRTRPCPRTYAPPHSDTPDTRPPHRINDLALARIVQ